MQHINRTCILTHSVGGSYLQNTSVMLRWPIFRGLTARSIAPSSINLTVCSISIVSVTIAVCVGKGGGGGCVSIFVVQWLKGIKFHYLSQFLNLP